MAIDLKEITNDTSAVATITEFKDNTDPLYIGPGTWNVIHRRAFKSQTNTQQIEFISLMKDICDGFPCHVCRGHCMEYIKNHPLEEYLNVTLDIMDKKIPLGMFIWTWKFHNAVNTRTKKPVMSWDTAYNLYSQTKSLVCSKNCLATEQTPPDTATHVSGLKIK